MSRKTVRYTRGEIGKIGPVVKDFLPPPDQLALREDNVKVTISLSRSSVDFFKAQARTHRAPYQKMIRSLLDHYADRHSQA